MIHCIEHIRSELQMQLLRNREILSERKIEVPQARPANRSISDIAGADSLRRSGADRNPRKSGRVQVPQSGSVIRQSGLAANIVGTAVSNPRSLSNGYRAAGSRCENSRRLPAPQRIPQGVPVIQQRETVQPFGNKVM